MKAKTRKSGGDGIYHPSGRVFREDGTVVKDWGGKIPVALVYPNSYRIGMSNLGVHALYRLFNNEPDILCERFFLDITDRGHHVSIESGRPLTDFSVVAFSVSFELDYFAIPAILKAAGIPVYASERDETYPLILGGGPCLTGNPMPVAPFFDVLAIGEAEAILPGILPVLRENLMQARSCMLEDLAGQPGVYVPLLPPSRPVARQYTHNLDVFDTTTSVVTRDTELGELYLIEAERGCQRGCRFCLVNGIYSPMRFRSASQVLSAAKEGLRYRTRIGLVGPAVTDHPDIIEILGGLSDLGAETAVSSLRISSLSEGIVAALARGKAKTITIAPEAGSQRLRDVINKGITDEDIVRTVDIIAAHGFRQVKMYSIVGLPTETDDDIEQLIRMAVAARERLDAAHTRLTVNAAPFVPKAGTPFQWLPMATRDVLQKRLSHLRNTLKHEGIAFNDESPAWSEMQAALSRGNETFAPVIAAMPKLTPANWRRLVDEAGIDLNHYVNAAWPPDAPLPWDIIAAGPPKERLCKGLETALKGQVHA